jgi:hypothetical protein
MAAFFFESRRFASSMMTVDNDGKSLLERKKTGKMGKCRACRRPN